MPNYEEGIERITALISHRAELIAALPSVREPFEQAIAEYSRRTRPRQLFRGQNQVTAALLAHDPAATEQSARGMESVVIDDPRLRAATDAYADAVFRLPATEGQIAELDREVLGTEGQMIGRVTDLLRDLSDRRGRVLSRDFARTLASDKWQSILLGDRRRADRPCCGAVRGAADGAAAQGDRHARSGLWRGREKYVDSGHRGRERNRRHRARRGSVPPHARRCRCRA